ncbi:10 kDa heat shock protein, mitochondrial-like [Camelus dromedarius]|uniref:10 kDa heat shock protein, mitochondrial-like n=1 Tax=Camelus dromedarius TaxID=9838 RepID=UPI0031195041
MNVSIGTLCIYFVFTLFLLSSLFPEFMYPEGWTVGFSLRQWREGRLRTVGTRVMAGKAFRKFVPLFDRVLNERSAAETVTKGGIMLPEKSQGKVLQATVVAAGSGCKGKGGGIQPVSVKVGDKVLLPEYGGTKVVLDDKEYKDYFLFRDGDILGKYID